MNIDRDMEENTYRQGFLQRKKAVAKSVRKRWFCLMSDALVTFKSEEDAKNAEECIDVLPLMDVQTVKKQYTNSQRYPFEIITRQKTYVFLTDSPYEQDQWVKAFHTAMQLRCFNTNKDEVASKYNGFGKDRRSSAGTRKLSQLKKYVQDGWRPSGIQRKSSGVDCDASEAEYQGIPIGNIDNEGTDEVFEEKRSISQSSKSPQIVQYVTVHEDSIESSGARGQSRASDDSGQGYHDVRNLDSSGNNAQDGESTSGASSERSKSASTKTKTMDPVPNGSGAASSWPTTTPSVPPPVPEPAARNRSTKRVFEDEKIYDEPCREDGIYDVPPREVEESVPSAMGDLQKIINECSEEKDKSDIVLERGPKQTDFSSGDEPTGSLEEEMTHQGVGKSAMAELKDLLDSLEEL